MRMVYEKYSAVDDLLKSDVRSLLDVGCRDAILRKHIRPQIEYTGVDIVPGPGVDKVASIEDGLPFADGEFDAVVALDLLEHTNNIWFAFDELVRVARRQVVIILPNVYHWSSRVRFFLGQEMDKYVLPAHSIVDRHRWLPSYVSARRFCTERAAMHGLDAKEQVFFGGRRTFPVDLLLSRVSNNLAAWAVMYVLERPS